MARYVAFLRAVSPMNAKMPELKRKAEAAMAKRLGKSFYTIVRSSAALQKMLDADPFSRFRLSKKAKRVVTFVRKPRPAKLKLPIELHGARILAMNGGDIFTAYLPGRRGPVFMNLIDKTFGKTVTTRSWDTVKKCAAT